MIEAYAFLAMFAVQILAMSILHPTWFIKRLRLKIKTDDPAGQLYVAHRLTQYRILNTVIAVLGVLLLTWLFHYVRLVNWDEGYVGFLVTLYFWMQVLPICVVAWIVARFNKALRRSSPKRKANLTRRGLFDFVSWPTILIALLVYFLFAALVFYIARDPFPGFAGPLINIGIVTLGYAFVSLGVYVVMYRTKSSPLETYADRMYEIAVGVKLAIYCCVAAVGFAALSMMLRLLDLKLWGPFALSFYYVTLTLAYVYSTRSKARPSPPAADGLRSNPIT